MLPIDRLGEGRRSRRRFGLAQQDRRGARRGLRPEGGQRRPAGDALHRKRSDAAHPRSALARASGRDGLHAPGHFPAQLRAEESRSRNTSARRSNCSPAMLDRIKFDTVTTVSKIQVRSQAEIEREELERQQRLARALQAQHAEAMSPIQAVPGLADAAGRRRPGRVRRQCHGSGAARGRSRAPRRSCAPCPRWAATSPVPAGPAASTSTVTARCSKRAVDSRPSDVRPIHVVAAAVIDARGPRADRAAAARASTWRAAGSFPAASSSRARIARRGSRASCARNSASPSATPRPLIRVRHAYPLRRGAARRVGGAALLAASRGDSTARRCAGARGTNWRRRICCRRMGRSCAALRLPERLTQVSTPDYVLGRSAEAGCRWTAARRLVRGYGGCDGGERCRRGFFGAAA